MNETNKNTLPPIVVDFIEKLGNRSATSFQRASYALTLERIRNACDVALQAYASEQKGHIIPKRK